jgi:hypothetical protein
MHLQQQPSHQQFSFAHLLLVLTEIQQTAPNSMNVFGQHLFRKLVEHCISTMFIKFAIGLQTLNVNILMRVEEIKLLFAKLFLLEIGKTSL